MSKPKIEGGTQNQGRRKTKVNGKGRGTPNSRKTSDMEELYSRKSYFSVERMIIEREFAHKNTKISICSFLCLF